MTSFWRGGNRHPRGETVSILPYIPGARDAHGNATAGFGVPVPYDGCAVAPINSTEPNEPGRNAVITGYTVYGPTGMVITPRDHAVIRGIEYQIDGEPGVWKNPYTGESPGNQFAVKRIEG